MKTILKFILFLLAVRAMLGFIKLVAGGDLVPSIYAPIPLIMAVTFVLMFTLYLNYFVDSVGRAFIIIPMLTIWSYFSYQALKIPHFTLSKISEDISLGWSFMTTNWIIPLSAFGVFIVTYLFNKGLVFTVRKTQKIPNIFKGKNNDQN